MKIYKHIVPAVIELCDGIRSSISNGSLPNKSLDLESLISAKTSGTVITFFALLYRLRPCPRIKAPASSTKYSSCLVDVVGLDCSILIELIDDKVRNYFYMHSWT